MKTKYTFKPCSHPNALSKQTVLRLDRTLVEDWEGAVFINPFDLLRTTKERFLSIMNYASDELADDSTLGLLSQRITKNLKDLTLNQLESDEAKEKESDVFKAIRKHITEAKIKHEHSDHIITKYIWLEEFMKWLSNDEDSKLQFKFRF